MLFTLNSWFIVLAAESHGIPGSDWRAKISVPLGIVIFLGSVYLLVRSNLGTRRGYLVMATSLFGFMVIYSAFWAFGAPGTPPATGPQNLPGQELDAYEDTWRAFAGDSLVADDQTYAVAKSFPEGFADDPAAAGLDAGFEGEANIGSDEVLTFFSTQEGPLTDPPIGGTWTEVDRKYAVATNERPIIGVTFQQTWQVAQVAPGEAPPDDGPQLTPDGERAADDGSNVAPAGTEIGDVVEDGETYTAFAYFDAGSPAFPSLLTLGLMFLLFLIHAALLALDEDKERREREVVVAEVPAEEPVGAGQA
jgi:hypothetical protein